MGHGGAQSAFPRKVSAWIDGRISSRPTIILLAQRLFISLKCLDDHMSLLAPRFFSSSTFVDPFFYICYVSVLGLREVALKRVSCLHQATPPPHCKSCTFVFPPFFLPLSASLMGHARFIILLSSSSISRCVSPARRTVASESNSVRRLYVCTLFKLLLYIAFLSFQKCPHGVGVAFPPPQISAKNASPPILCLLYFFS